VNILGNKRDVALTAALFAVAMLSYEGYRLYTQNTELKNIILNLTDTLEMTERNLEEITRDSASLLEALSAEQQKNEFLSEQADTFSLAVQKLSGTVLNLEKIGKTDPELLIKYSKVYFLNEHYIPERLSLIPMEYIYNEKEEYFHARALPHLENLLKSARSAGAELLLISAFRSFETQKDLKSQYKVTYGKGANTFSAEQGYSEHQLGVTVDFTTLALGATFSKFDTTGAFEWLNQNARTFGFILSYPNDNAYYIYEPWHWRFVGIELATKLHDESRRFYDMEQREISGYLLKIFD